jgi:endonuclease/exonuclease/phosphatase (EEP) superfamily protein YafD
VVPNAPIVSRAHRNAGRVLGGGLLLAGWVITIALAVLVAARVVAFDHARLLVIANSLTYWIFLPEYLVLAAAIAARKYVLVACAAALVFVHVVLVWPSLGGPAEIPASAYHAPRIRIFSANVLFDNAQPHGIIGEIEAARPDVIVLQEFSQHWDRVLRASRIWDAYPYHLIVGAGHESRSALLSRLELESPRIQTTLGAPLLQATVDVGGRRMRIVDVHPVAPAFNYQRWRAQADAVTRSLRRAHGRLVAAGDFNATQFNSWLSELEDLGLRSAHEELGRGTATTWPNHQFPFPPIRLDHVLVSDDVVPLSIREGTGQGSDHRPLIVDLALLARSHEHS